MSSNLPPDDRDPGPGEPPGTDDLLAAELVLGVLSAEARRTAQARTAADSPFATQVSEWERRLVPWLSDVEGVAVPAHVWQQIKRQLGWQPEPAALRLWHSVGLWRAATGLASLAAVAIWVTRVTAPAPPPPVAAVQPPRAELAARPVTTLAHDDGTPGWLASVDTTRGTVLMVPVPGAPDAQGRVPELWIIPAGKPPRSLGLVSVDKAHTVTVPPDSRAALVPGSVLAISLEPPGGAPHGAPTGPIIAKGALNT
ncbi:MAG: anti-sigma factor [Proteobacteria bacterium]|nr:anti-sigma factor [Pseudomonadota bacterium]